MIPSAVLTVRPATGLRVVTVVPKVDIVAGHRTFAGPDARRRLKPATLAQD